MSEKQPTPEDGEEAIQATPSPKVVLQDQPVYQPDMETRQRQWELQRERATQDKLRGLCLAYPEVAELVAFKAKASGIIGALSARITELQTRLGEPTEAPAPQPTIESAEPSPQAEESGEADDGDGFHVPAQGRRRRRQQNS